MKVAVFSASASPHMRAYLGALVDAGHDVTLITSNDGNADLGVPVFDIIPRGRFAALLPSGVRVRLAVRRLRSLLRSGRYDALNVQQVTSDGVRAALAFDRPVVLTFWGSDLLLPERMPEWAREALPGVVRSAAVVHVCSDPMKVAALRLGAVPERLVNFQYGVDLGLFRFGGAPRPAHTVVSTRLLAPLYRIDVLVRAFALVRASIADATLTVFGRGTEQAAHVALAAELGVADDVRFTGFAPSEDLAMAVATDAVWVSLPPSDGTPLSLLEAMAGGAVPVVADIPTLHDWIGPGRGVFVTDVTPEGVAAGIIEGFAIAAAGEYAGPNRQLVEERGDRARNLPRFVRIVTDAAAGRLPSAADRG